MKEWQQNIIKAIAVIIIGIVLTLWTKTIGAPAPWEVTPEFYFIAFDRFLALAVSGAGFLGMGIGILLNTRTIYELEKKLAS